MPTRIRPDLPDAVSAATAAAFGAGSLLRSARVFHPRGVAFHAVLRRAGLPARSGSPFLDRPGEHAAIVRLSKAAGLPDPFPDVLGIAVRAVDADGPGAHRDLLFASSASPPYLRHLLVPARRFGRRVCSAILPYRTPSGFALLAAAAEDGPGLSAMASGATQPPPIRLLAATPRGPWRAFAVVLPTTPLSAEERRTLAFDPWNAGADLRPAGFLNALRHPAYAASRSARPGAEPAREIA